MSNSEDVYRLGGLTNFDAGLTKAEASKLIEQMRESTREYLARGKAALCT